MYAVVDIETTGGSAAYHKITDIAIVIHNGKEVVERYETLVNPGRPIPAGITALTGISNEMVMNAPSFDEVAYRIHELTTNKIFVAHNVNFDYSFIKAELELAGIPFLRKKLCTVRLSRRILPGIPSYSLGNLCNHVGINIYNRHRAGGDADATACLLTLLLESDKENFVSYSLNKLSKEASLPPNLPKIQFEQLPEKAGIYNFHDKSGKIVYVGKANNIKKRVSSHFSGSTNTRTRQNFLNTLYAVTYEICGSELVSFLLENEEIKKHWPRFNRSYKSVTLNWGIYQYEDQSGYLRFVIGQAGKRDKPCIIFKNQLEATSFMLNKVKAYNLCLRLCGIIETQEKCQMDNQGWLCSVCNGSVKPEAYNLKFNLALTSFKESDRSFVIVGKGKHEEESSVVVVENGKYLGFGYIPMQEQLVSFHSFKEYIKTCYDNLDVQNIINAHLKKCRSYPGAGYILYKSK